MDITIKSTIDKNAKIAVLYGGISNEREVSLRSGKNVFEALKRLGYDNTILLDVDENIDQKLKENKIEIAYNALHGKGGEDGCIQGILELLKIKYTGCGVMASSVCMNKEYTKKMLTSSTVPLIKSVFIRKNESYKDKITDLKFPVMIKPVSEGSSIGMYKVNKLEDLQEAFKNSLKCNQDIMIEEFVKGINCTVGVLDNDGEIFATEILELRTKTEWYDYDAKYTQGLTEFILPAELTPEMTKLVKEKAIEAFKCCGCQGVSRIDFIIANDIPYCLEINTSPGMTDLSDLPAQANAMGLNYDNLVQLILNGAEINK